MAMVECHFNKIVNPLVQSPISVFPNEGTMENHYVFREKSWNK